MRSASPRSTTNCSTRMRRETLMFVTALIREDRSILDFIDGRFTFLNGPLARHYGIKGVDGEEFQRVELAGRRARRHRDAGVDSDALFLRDADLAGAARQMGAGELCWARRCRRRPPMFRRWKRRTSAPPRRCGSGWNSIARTQPAPPATTRWIRSVSAWRTTMPPAAGAPRTATSTWTASGRCRTARRSRAPRG